MCSISTHIWFICGVMAHGTIGMHPRSVARRQQSRPHYGKGSNVFKRPLYNEFDEFYGHDIRLPNLAIQRSEQRWPAHFFIPKVTCFAIDGDIPLFYGFENCQIGCFPSSFSRQSSGYPHWQNEIQLGSKKPFRWIQARRAPVACLRLLAWLNHRFHRWRGWSKHFLS